MNIANAPPRASKNFLAASSKIESNGPWNVLAGFHRVLGKRNSQLGARAILCPAHALLPSTSEKTSECPELFYSINKPFDVTISRQVTNKIEAVK